jgi:hypothetical protein
VWTLFRHKFNKPNLRQWIRLEDIRSDILKAAENKDTIGFSTQMYLYISTAFNIPINKIEKFTWEKCAELYMVAVSMCIPRYDVALLKSRMKDEKESWDYHGRTWYIWSHMLSSNYGWTLDTISAMDFEDAISLMQEILINEQLNREWEWGLSEIAYSYNPTSKESKLRKLPRPDWMEVILFKPIKKVRMLRSMMPVGAVIRMDGTHETVTIE